MPGSRNKSQILSKMDHRSESLTLTLYIFDKFSIIRFENNIATISPLSTVVPLLVFFPPNLVFLHFM